MRPISQVLRQIVQELDARGQPGADSTSSLSVIGQIVFYHHCRPAMDKIYPDVCYTREEIDKLAEHVTQFSLAALKNLKVT